MSPLFETIKVKDRQFFNLDFHNARMNDARKKLYNCTDLIDLNKVLYLPKSVGPQIHKCKVIYEKDIVSIHFQPYHFREIKTLKVVHDDDINYGVKSIDRTHLNQLFQKRESCDDVLIIKNNNITDTSYANIIFFDGKRWVTPSSSLLKGTKRAKLLKEKEIIEKNITIEMLPDFQKAKLINAMMNIEDTQPIEMKNIIN